MRRVSRETNALLIAAKGRSPSGGAPLTCAVGDRAYEVEVTLDLLDNADGGLLLFCNHKACIGVGFSHRGVKTFSAAEEQGRMRGKPSSA